MLSESCLERSHDRLTESGEHRLWCRRCPNSVDDVLRPRVDEDLEQLLAALGVVGQRSVGEAKPSDIIRASDGVEDTATVQGPEAEVSDHDGDDRSDRDGRVSREGFDPPDIELLPRQQRGSQPQYLGSLKMLETRSSRIVHHKHALPV